MQTGVDLIEVARLQQAIDRHGERFLKRVFTAAELEQVGEDVPSLAARWAAKEAVSKALRTGIGDVSWQEIEVLRGKSNEPILNLNGEAQRLAGEQGLENWSVSLSHTQDYAVAMVVAT
ncbi:MAG: holo-[acyl-carrier-protein] synthase [Chloroflexi bacterium]|nr:holo-[acyl-carrier-protein] synthase [Chloroflexota bacterium]